MTRERRKRQVIIVVALAIAAGVLAFLAFGGIGENLVYYWSPSELHEAGPKAVGASIRLGGLVEEGSIRYGEGSEITFAVTDGDARVVVTSTAVPPAMFREGIGVVVEGTIDDSGNFVTQRLMVKHDNQYQAPGTEDERKMKELMQTMQFESTSG
jgi:cytochrome c-type biogenesis protein CcmE